MILRVGGMYIIHPHLKQDAMSIEGTDAKPGVDMHLNRRVVSIFL